MVKVYRINVDYDAIQGIETADKSFILEGGISTNGLPKGEDWNPPEFYVSTPLNPRANFFHCLQESLWFDEEARYHEEVGSLMDRAGEILSLPMETGETLYMLNVTVCPNVLDQKKTEWSLNLNGRGEMERSWIQKPVFIPERFNFSHIFKVPEQVNTHVYTYTESDCEDEYNFINCYKASGLTGLVFEEVWHET